MSAVEVSLDTTLPPSLKHLLTATNGVMNLMKLESETIETGWLIWPLENILNENLSLRTEANKAIYEQPFDELLFFANAGADGILFAYKISAKEVAGPEIYVWHPIEDALTQMAPSLEAFIEQWISGKMLV